MSGLGANRARAPIIPRAPPPHLPVVLDRSVRGQLRDHDQYLPLQLINYVLVDYHTMALPSPIPDELVDLIAHRFHLLAEPTRIRLFDRLRGGEATVHELAAGLETSQQNVSKHLTLLAEAGVLGRRKDRNSVYYRITDQEVLGLCEQVCGSVERHLLELAALVQSQAQPERSSR